MDNQLNDVILARYLSNECNDAEIERVQAWLNSNLQNQKFMKLMKAVWDVHEIQPTPETQKLWSALLQQISEDNIPGKIDIPEKATPSHYIFKQPIWIYADNYRLLKYAAVFLFMIIVPYIVTIAVKNIPRDSESDDLKTLIVDTGQRSDITLSDGTKVTLDAGSCFKYPQRFAGDTRSVYLTGEAYFEVSAAKNKPFIIHASDARIEVVGTKFNVRAWEQISEVEVAVAEGSVSLQSEINSDQQAVIIAEGYMSTLPKHGLPTTPCSVEIKKQIAWLSNEVYFENAPLHEVLFQLERWYGLRFVIANSAIINEHINIHIQKKSMDDILELVSLLTDLSYQREGNTIYLTIPN